MMTRFQIALYATLCMAAMPLAGQVITTADERSKLLDGLERTLNNREVRPPSEDVRSPFILPPVEPPPRPVVVDEDTGEEVEVADEALQPRILPDAVALEAIARQFRPLGSIVRGDRGILQLRGGGSISSGESFGATIQGHSYSVTIESVSESGYILKLGTARIQRNFFTNQP